MLTFLILSGLVLAVIVIGGLLTLPFLLIGAVVWLLLLPFRLLFKLVFGIGGALLGLLLTPFVMVIVAVALIGAAITALLGLAVPLVPVILLALLVWGILRVVTPTVV